jgi:hypothetical protein
MAKHLSALWLMFLPLLLAAQIHSMGPRAGLSLSQFSNLTSFQGASPRLARVGITAGGFVTYPIADNIAIQPELLYALQGDSREVSYQTSTGGVVNIASRATMHYFQLPVYARYYFWKGLYGMAGPQFGYLLEGKERLRVNEPGRVVEQEIPLDEYRRFDLAMSVAVGYELNGGLMVEGRYSLGLLDVSPGGESNRLSSLSLILGWAFPVKAPEPRPKKEKVKKKKEKAAEEEEE